MTQTMKAAVLSQFGSADMFKIRDVPVPPVGPSDLACVSTRCTIKPLNNQTICMENLNYV